jgi:hypothetical protein
MNLFAVHLMHDLGIDNSDIRLIHNSETHTSYLEIHVHYLKDRLLFGDKHINGTMKLILDNGWDYIRVELQDISQKDVQDYLFSLSRFIVQVKCTYPDMFGEFNPSERD